MDDLFANLNAVLSPLPSSVHARHFSANTCTTTYAGKSHSLSIGPQWKVLM